MTTNRTPNRKNISAKALFSVFSPFLGVIFFAVMSHGAMSHGGENADGPKPFRYVCTDGGNGGYEAFPDICHVSGGRLLAVFYDGYGHISVPTDECPKGGRISGCYSDDAGVTWSKPFVLIDTPLDDRDPSIARLADGRLICNWFTYIAAEAGRAEYCATCIAFSSDDGQTWTPPRELFPGIPCSTPVRILSDGRLILPTYVENSTDHSGSVAYSDDLGETWSENIVIPNGGVKLDAETDVIELNDGSLYALQRAQMAFSRSTDRGETWSVSEDVGFVGHCPYLLRHSDGTIFVSFRLPNTSMRFSRDECRTWSENVEVDSVIGAYPSMVELSDGTVLIVYYEEGTGSSIRCRKFRLADEKEGKEAKIEWLDF